MRRNVRSVRTDGRADGLTKPQAERALRRMRELDRPSPTPTERVTMERPGNEFWQRLELKGRRKSHRLTVASDLRNHRIRESQVDRVRSVRADGRARRLRSW